RHTAWLGLFYAGNILGGVAGCLAAGFYLLRVYDMNVATYVAVAINVIVAAAAFAMVRLEKAAAGNWGPPVTDSAVVVSGFRRTDTRVLMCIALSGFCALAAEVLWTRMLSLIFGATSYTF